MFKKFTERARRVIILAREEAEKYQHEYLGTEHILLGIIKDGGGIAVLVLQRLGIDIKQLRAEIERNLPESSNTLIIGDIPFTSGAKKVLEYAVEEARSIGHTYIGTEHLLIGLIKEKDGVAYRILLSFGLQYADIKEQTINLLREPVSQAKETTKTPAMDEFGRDLTELAMNGKLDPVIGRINEIERVIQILSRRTKNNPVLIGEPGVGKTAIVEGLAQRIVSREVPQTLYDKRLISLDLGAIIAGTKYRGQFEARIKAIMREITQPPNNIILFVDEIHTLIGAGAAEGSVDASNMLKPALSRGEIQCIGATTLDEYRRYIEKNGALERRFQPIIVNPPSVEETIQIIKGLKDEYEIHHKAKITENAIVMAAQLSDRYINDRFLPDKAIDIIDEACSRVRLRRVTFPPEVREMQRKIDETTREKRERIEAQEFEKAVELRDKEESLKNKLEQMKRDWEKSQDETNPEVTEDDITYVISRMTGIPLSRIEKEEFQRLQEMETEIAKKIIGQKEAIELVCKAIRRSRAGLKDIKRPMGSFLFLGPTGVGKTELACILAEYLFGDRRAIIRLDMSEYMEKFSVSRLTGAPPGYVGYEEGGQLTEKIRRRPYSVVLLDEIEKAHPDIFNMLLQIMDDGRLTDSYGRTVDFRNVILIMTSNLHARFLEKGLSMGFQREGESSSFKKYKDSIKSELKKTFSPEFLNRIDDAVIFHPLEKEHILKIVDILINDLNTQLIGEGIALQLEDGVKEWLANAGYNPSYGARHLKRTIQKHINDPISEGILFGKFKDTGIVHVRLQNDELVFEGKKDPVGNC
ncbi:MAG: ATP-dependent Clp protease ATP-binding subunit [Nitrospinae bacterium]|nr:ATP-dependent Clp protease ATP-binding subunit [Nitrospinota bacterium]